MSVAVVIPAYNAEAFVGEAIESVLNQSKPPEAVIVVDDGSTDRTAQVVESFRQRVRLLRQKNQGVAKARNAGAQIVDTEWLAFLDADDVWLPRKTELQLSALAHSRRKVALGAITVVDGNLRSLEDKVRIADRTDLTDLIMHKPGIPESAPSTIVVERKLFASIRGFDPNLATTADWDLMIRLRMRVPFAYVREPLILYRRHRANMSHDVGMLERESVMVLEKTFAAADLPAELRRLRKQYFAYNDVVLAGSHFWAGNWLRSTLFGLRGLRNDPRLLGHVVAAPLRQLRRMQLRQPSPGSF